MSKLYKVMPEGGGRCLGGAPEGATRSTRGDVPGPKGPLEAPGETGMPGPRRDTLGLLL